MIRIVTTPEQVKRARELYRFGALKNSIKRGESNIFGALGEIVFGDYYPDWQKIESYDFDFRNATGFTVDVKSANCGFPPGPEWNCSVAKTSQHQKPDIYFFARVKKDLSTVWLLGWVSREAFYETAGVGIEGEPDPNSRDGWPFRADCRYLRVDQLNEPALRDPNAACPARLPV